MIAFFDAGLDARKLPALKEWSREITTLESQCIQESIPAIQVTCWIQLAARYGEQGNEHKGMEACANLQGLSAHFKPEVSTNLAIRVCLSDGRGLKASGDIIGGLRHCAYAGPFAQNCITHSIWRNPVDLEFNSDTKSSVLLEEI